MISKCLFQKEEARHQKGTVVPVGSTGFGHEPARLEFSSTSYEWLVASQDAANAQLKRSGMINAAFDSNGNPYQFMQCAGDRTGASGTGIFCLKIWCEGADGVENVVYDNDAAQAIGGDSIVVNLGNYQDKGQTYVNSNS